MRRVLFVLLPSVEGCSLQKSLGLNTAIAWSLGIFTLTLIYLGVTKQLFHPHNSLWGFDKVALGMPTGMVVFFFSVFIDAAIRKNNKGKVLFYYQKVIIPFACLLLIALILRYIF